MGIHEGTMNRWELGKATLPEDALNRAIAILSAEGILLQPEDPPINIVWVNCPECAQTVPALIGTKKYHYCAACGESLGKLCDHCHHLNRYTAHYCEACGTPLKTHNTQYQILKTLPIPKAAEENGQPHKKP